MRQIVLDTETTGLETSQGHRIIEIGGVELVNRKLSGRHFHQYVNPHREIDQGAIEVHGITSEFLADKPEFLSVADEFMAYINGAELIIHNAPFDVGFLNYELSKLPGKKRKVEAVSTIIDTLKIARKKHPGQRNNLDALCGRYGVDNSQRDLHGALLDAEILADVYLAMTGGQTTFALDGTEQNAQDTGTATTATIRTLSSDRPKLKIVRASGEEISQHQKALKAIAAVSGDDKLVWQD